MPEIWVFPSAGPRVRHDCFSSSEDDGRENMITSIASVISLKGNETL